MVIVCSWFIPAISALSSNTPSIVNFATALTLCLSKSGSANATTLSMLPSCGARSIAFVNPDKACSLASAPPKASFVKPLLTSSAKIMVASCAGSISTFRPPTRTLPRAPSGPRGLLSCSVRL